MKRYLIIIFCLSLLALSWPLRAQASEVLGIHILSPQELTQAKELLETSNNGEQWKYVTVPFTLADADRVEEWQQFFDQCQKDKFIPIVRLATTAEGASWKIPTKKDIVTLSSALRKLNWPTDERIIIVFNEPNHAKEWGNTLDPEGYAETLSFTSDWFRTERAEYTILPAGLDLAAPNGKDTMEAFAYWKKALKAYPELLASIDAWNSHSYPNPGFSSAPAKKDKMSLRGFQHELAFAEPLAGRKLDVYITETGWEENSTTARRLNDYYAYAMKNIWSDERVKAVTPFLLKGAPGPFERFSFFDKEGNRTRQFEAYRKVIEGGV